jgi:hypothetical protein
MTGTVFGLLETFLETISFFLPPGMRRYLRFALGVFFLLIWAAVVVYSFDFILVKFEPPPTLAAPLPDDPAAMKEFEGVVEPVRRDVEAVRADLEGVKGTVERIERALKQEVVRADLEAVRADIETVRGTVERIEQVVTQTPPSPTGIVVELNCKTCVPDSEPLLPVTGGP